MNTWRGRYVRSDSQGAYVTVAEYGHTLEFGPCQTTLDVEPNVGDIVVVEQVGELAEDVVITGIIGGQGVGGGPGGGAPSGPAGGDLSGTYPNPQIKSGTIVVGDLDATLQAFITAQRPEVYEEGTPVVNDAMGLNFIGAGVTATNDGLGNATITIPGSVGVTDGDKGDILVSGGGSSWMIDTPRLYNGYQVTDCNNANTPGWWWTSAGVTNTPSGVSGIGIGQTLWRNASTTGMVQEYWDRQTGVSYTRVHDSASWSAWRQVATASNPASGSTSTWLRGDGSWQTLPSTTVGDGDKGDIVIGAPLAASGVWTIDNLAVTTAKLADGAVTSAKIFDGTIALADLSATGTRDTTTFLRGDNTWASPATPAGVGQVGEIALWGTSAAPANWLLCDGKSYPTATYPDLFAAIGYTYGGSGANFNVPDLKGKVPVGLDNRAAGTADTSFDALNDQGGEKNHTIQLSELPQHSHAVADHYHGLGNHTHDLGNHQHTIDHGHVIMYAKSSNTQGGGTADRITDIGGGGLAASSNPPSAAWSGNNNGNTGLPSTSSNYSSPTLTSTGNVNGTVGGSGNNMPPYLVLNYIIRHTATPITAGGTTIGVKEEHAALSSTVSVLDFVGPGVVAVDKGGGVVEVQVAGDDTNALHKTGAETAVGKKTFQGGDGATTGNGIAAAVIKGTAGTEPSGILRFTDSADTFGGVIRLNRTFGQFEVMQDNLSDYRDLKAAGLYDNGGSFGNQRVWSRNFSPSAKVQNPAITAYTWTTVTHSLNSPRLTSVQFQDATTKENVDLNWKEVNTNSIQVWSAVNIAANALNIMCIGV